MTTPEQRAELLALEENKTPRFWRAIPYGNGLWGISAYSRDGDCLCEILKGVLPEFNARYIESACNLVPELAREVGFLTARAEKAEAERDWLVDKIAAMGAEYGEHAVCPTLSTPCAPASYDCTICWNKAAAEAQRKEGAE